MDTPSKPQTVIELLVAGIRDQLVIARALNEGARTAVLIAMSEAPSNQGLVARDGGSACTQADYRARLEAVDHMERLFVQLEEQLDRPIAQQDPYELSRKADSSLRGLESLLAGFSRADCSRRGHLLYRLQRESAPGGEPQILQ